MNKPHERKMRKIDKIVFGLFLYWILFVIIAWITYWVTGGIPDTLVQCGLGGGAVELAATAAIEVLSNKAKKKEEELP